MEGPRFFDLVRWKSRIYNRSGTAKIPYGEPQASTVVCQFTPGKNDFFPYPSRSYQFNYNLIQYPDGDMGVLVS